MASRDNRAFAGSQRMGRPRESRVPRAFGRATIGWVVASILAVGCVPNMSVERGGTVQAPLSEKPYTITCDEGHRYAARALRARDYKVTEVNRSAAGGSVIGVKQDQTSTMTINCAADGVRLKASGGGIWVEQGIQFSFHQVVEKGDKIWPPPKAPRVMVEWIDGPESKLWFPQEIGSVGLTAEIGRAHSELQSQSNLVCRLLLE